VFVEGADRARQGEGLTAESPVIWDGRYRLIRTLGEGGMGRVMLAHDIGRGEQPVAIKILLPEYLDTITEFLHEYALHRRLSHPNIPRVFELGFAHQPRATFPYFAMEYCRGVPLLSATRRAPGLRRVFDVVAGLLRALDHMHRQGLVHADVKPGNILVAGDGDEVTSYLIDMGVSAPVGGYTDDDVFIGTPEYAAPELMLGVGVDQRADLYAVGLILYELIDQRRPWPGEDEMELLIARRAGPPPPIRALDCPARLRTLVERLLDPDVSRRPASAAEVLAEMADALRMEAEIEPPQAFVRRLMVAPHPCEVAVAEPCRDLLDGLSLVDGGSGPVGLVIEGEPGMDARRVATLVADRASLLGIRVLRVTARGAGGPPLSTLAPGLDVIRRLHPELIAALDATPSPVTAARALSGSGRPMLIVLDGLDVADAATVSALFAALTRPDANLRLVATARPIEGGASPELASLLALSGVARVRLTALDDGAALAWLDATVGSAALHPSDRDALLQAARGTVSGLLHGLHDLYRRGRIARRDGGYAPGVLPAVAQASEASAPPPERVDEVEALVACITAPVGERALQKYLGRRADVIPHLLSSRLLVQRDDGTYVVEDEAHRAAVYGRISPAERSQNHRRLAVALEEVRSRDSERVAREYALSDTPLLAVPHLVAAARRAPSAGRPQLARALLERAEQTILQYDEGATSLDLWRFWALLWRADAQVSLETGNLVRFEGVVDELVRLGTDMAHRATLKAALEFRLTVAVRRRAWHRLVEDAGALLALDPEGPTADGLGRLRWAKALRYRADGLPAHAIEQLDRALEGRAEMSPDVELLVLGSRAQLFVGLQWHAEAEKAVSEHIAAARRAGRHVEALRGRTLGATLMRLRGRPDEALAETRRLLRELEGERTPGVDGLIEWELACCHLELGWFTSARDHAIQAQAMAAADGDDGLALRALMVEALAARHAGAAGEAWALALQARQRAAGEEDDGDRVNARLLAMEFALEAVGLRPLEDLAKEASEIGWRSQRRQEGARAARAFALAARAAILLSDGNLAVQWTTLALRALERFTGEHIHLPRHLALASRAHGLARSREQADFYRQRARSELFRIASRIGDPELRHAWIAHPDHADIDVEGLDFAEVVGPEPLPPTARAGWTGQRKNLRARIRSLVGLGPRPDDRPLEPSIEALVASGRSAAAAAATDLDDDG